MITHRLARTVLVAGLLAVVGGVRAEGAIDSPDGPVALVVTRPTDRGGLAAQRACRDPRTHRRGCTLRAALAVAAESAKPTSVYLPPGAIWLSSGRPLPVAGTVEIVGAGLRESTIVATDSRAFRLEPGAELDLRDLAVVGGNDDAPTSVGPGRASLREVLVADRPGADLTGADLAVICGPPGSGGRFLRVRSAVLVEPRAVSALPGALA